MNRGKIVLCLQLTILLLTVSLAEAQQGKIYRLGVVHQGGQFQAVVDGLRDGLKELGYEEGKQIQLDIRDAKGDLGVVKEAAKAFEREKANLIYAVTTTVVTAVKESTVNVPIVFAVATDPVSSGLIQSFVKPGGRLTGVYYLTTDLTAKRLEILKEIVPKLRKVVTFYDSGNEVALAAAKSGREAARQLSVEIVERPIASVEELRLGLMALKAEDADAYYFTSDAMVTSQAQFIIDTARAKKLPTIGYEQSLVAQGALVSYGVSYYEIGRLSAKYVQRVLTGTSPQNLPVESISRLGLAVNLKTARELGLTIPQAVLMRADVVIPQ